ncbi:MAG: DUF4407 domain-containing protein [Prevotellaceae bacterium]|jgi:hypothetical protein|nr:DUF4407 domain-containing protein [Prevotellaceae bacterium]
MGTAYYQSSIFQKYTIMLENDIDFKDRKLSLIQRFFIICSGADKSIIRNCPTEWNKYTGIGATIFFTGLLAWLSGSFALYTVFRNTGLYTIDRVALLYAIPFGFLWGAVIFNLDRFIVSTFHKTEEKSFFKRLSKELLQASPRVLLAIIIAVTISKPIEIKIFESRLAEQIQRNEITAKKNNISEFNTIHELATKEGRVANLNTTITELQNELVTDPQNVKDLINNDLASANSELSSIKNKNNPKINANKEEINAIHNNSESYIYTIDSLGNKINAGYTQEARDRRYVLNQEIQLWTKEIKEQQDNVDRINKRINEERALYRQQKNEEIANRKLERDSAEVQLKTSMATAEKEAEDANTITETAFSNNFITQIEALGDLTDSDSTMWWTSLMITLLFLTIELAPILTKLVTKRGAYDEVLDRVEYEKMVEQRSIISQTNSKINEHLRRSEDAAKMSGDIMIQKQRDKLDAELKNNKEILDAIAKYQKDLALEALEKWYREQKNNTVIK